jgi:hypothetical protein
MSSTDLELIRLAKQAKGDIVTEQHKPAGPRSKPSFLFDVLAPSALAAIFVSMVIGGAGAALIYRPFIRPAGSEPIDPLTFVLALAVGAGGYYGYRVLIVQLDNYRELQWDTRTARIAAPRPPENPRGRWLEEPEPGRLHPSRCTWEPGWRRLLANQVLDANGEWVGGDRPIRDLFRGIVTAYATQYQEGTEKIQKDLLDVGWLNEAYEWTHVAKREAREAQFVASGGFENG